MDEQPIDLEQQAYKMDIKFLATAYKDLQTQIEDLKAAVELIRYSQGKSAETEIVYKDNAETAVFPQE